jgi:hypothetical protein
MLFGAILLLSAIVQYVTANALAGPYQVGYSNSSAILPQTDTS